MKTKRTVFLSILAIAGLQPLFGAAGRAKDGPQFFIAVLLFLGAILGILYLIDYIKMLWHRFIQKNGNEHSEDLPPG